MIMTCNFIMCALNWHMNKYPNSVPIVCIFILITTVKVAVPQPSTKNCSLEFGFSYPSDSACEKGNWGGFLSKSCCGAEFRGYLYALGLRANKTGLIFLSSSEQKSCLASMKRNQENVCGIEKLTTGANGCSDYSLVDVSDKLGHELTSLSENCKSLSSDLSDESCSSCVKSWKHIGRRHSNLTNSESIMICRFAVLVSLTSSKIGDDENIGRIYECLSQKSDDYTENHELTSGYKKKTKIRTGIWVLIGCLVGFLVIIVIMMFILFKRCHRSKKSSKKHAFKDVLLMNPGCPKYRIKDVYSATNSLDESNFIGEGTAGKVYKGILANQQQIAVKHIINDGNVETFVREVTSLSHIKHPNLVTLLGYCLSEEECFLIYELCPNGNLAEWLFGKDNKVLSWIQRLEIAIGGAQGLHFLHTYSEGCIVHRDIKARVLNKGGSIKEFADPKLEAEYSLEAFDLTFKLALSCTSVKQERPSMEQVVLNLQKALNISTKERASAPEAKPDTNSTTN
ncbi:hypothetical protein COLO4_04780 [Corchorus olitorius]|uniref:Protein kinase domain-containing protein n=1 Tax=Corchorus olitorius TaxID=93759 RepID=A0A1R3KSU0_9ROSI|nr:hypothetical protein COLO4_04780 [Corchorus olitorius]